MFKQSILERIAEYQSKHSGISKYPALADVMEPGETGFVCRKISNGGYLLLSILEIPHIERKILTLNKDNSMQVEDFNGVFPYLAIVMESSSDQYSPKDIVMYDVQSMKHSAIDVVVNAAVGTYVPETSIIGKITI